MAEQKSELVADQMFEVFANERAVNEFVAKDRTLAQKVLDHIKGLISEIKNIYKKLVASGNYEDIAAWQEDLEALEKVNNMMLDALSDIEQRKNAGQKAEKNTSDEVKNSTKRNPAQNKYENDVDAVINGTYNSDSALIMGVTPQIYQELGFSKLPIAITKNHVYSIAVTEQQPKADGRYNKNVNYHGLGVQAVKDIYQNISDPIMVIASPDFQSKTQRESVHKVIAIVDLQVGGKQVIAPIEIDAEVTNGKQIIDVNLVSSYFDKSNLNKMLSEAVAQESSGGVGFFFVDKKRAKSIFKLSKVQYLSQLDSLNSNGIIHTIDEKVNRKIDSVLKSQQFIRWFGDWQNKPETASKIVNADGTPKIMYHGTQNDFTVFDKKKAKSSGYYGKGFYFTDSESHSSHYGKSMAVYLDVKNPLEQGKNHISKKQLRKFLEKVAENEDDYDIWNYGTDNIDKIINNIYRDDAFAVIQDVNATAIGDLAEAIDLFNAVNKTNYDGVITPTEVVVYKPTQIKSATDNIGTFDKDNPDIRYSTKRDADYMTAVESGDMKTAQRMVDEVAKENGYTPEHLYHGTNEFGFTQFDMDNSDDGISFFMSDKQSVSQGYMSYNNNSTDAYHNAPRRIGKKSDMKRTALSRTSSVNKVIDTLKKQFPYYAEARQATKSDVVSYLQKDISVNDAVSSANELLKLDVLSDVRALAESVVKASEDGSYNAWKNVADKYSEFDDVYDVTENIRQWNQALDLWDNIKRGVYTASDIVQEDSVYHNGKVESKSALIKRYNNSLQGESNGMYDLYANHSNQLVIEGNGGYWIDLPLGKMAQQYNDWWVNVKGNPALEGAIYTNGDTRSISEFAKAMGYHSVRFNNIYDSGASEGSGELSTVYSFFYPSQDIKSADPVTYDDDGNIIPPSQRFDESKDDIRFATKRGVANNTKTRYNKRSYYSEFDSLVMQWRNKANTRVGDVNIVSGKGGFVLLEATEDGYVELAKGNWQTVKELKAEYERAHKETNESLHNHSEEYGADRGTDTWDMFDDEDRGYGLGNNTNIEKWRLQTNSSRSDEYSRLGDKEESLKSTKRESSVSEDASDYILDTKEYQDIIKIVDQRYNLTNKKNLSPKAVERLAGKLLSNSKSKYDKGALTERLSALFDYMANSNELVWEDVIYMY